jgi:glycosyltransferase involved in cell wall biosynthesis
VKYIRDHRIQILHSTDRPRDAIACVLLGKLTGARSVVHVHVKFGDWMSRGVKWAFGQADALIAISEFVSDSLVGAGYDRARVHTILNSVDLPVWDPGLDPAEGRRSLGVPADAPLLLSVARLFRWKGHEELVRAIALVRREVPDVRLAIVGADDPQGVGTAAKLADLARELGVSGNVALVGHRKDIAKLLAACDIFALPSFEEPFGLVFAEAMAMKRPVVALDNGGTPEVVTNGENGLLAPPADVPRLAEHILTLIRDPSLRKRMGELGRRRVEARFTPERLAADIATLYTSLSR